MLEHKLIFCPKNHIYDSGLYQECPYCKKIDNEQKALYEAVGENGNVWKRENYAADNEEDAKTELLMPHPDEEDDDDGKTELLMPYMDDDEDRGTQLLIPRPDTDEDRGTQLLMPRPDTDEDRGTQLLMPRPDTDEDRGTQLLMPQSDTDEDRGTQLLMHDNMDHYGRAGLASGNGVGGSTGQRMHRGNEDSGIEIPYHVNEDSSSKIPYREKGDCASKIPYCENGGSVSKIPYCENKDSASKIPYREMSDYNSKPGYGKTVDFEKMADDHTRSDNHEGSESRKLPDNSKAAELRQEPVKNNVLENNSAAESRKVPEYRRYKGKTPVLGWLVCNSGRQLGCSFEILYGNNYICTDGEGYLFVEQSMGSGRALVKVTANLSGNYQVQAGRGVKFSLNDKAIGKSIVHSYDVMKIGNIDFVFVALVTECVRWGQ